MTKDRDPIAPQTKNQAMESAIDALAIADLLGKITYVNPSFLRLWEYSSADEILGRPITDFWLTTENARKVLQALADQGAWSGEITARKKSGRPFEVFMSASIVKDAQNAPLYIMAGFEDVSARKHAEERIRRLSSFPELNPNPILEIGAGGKLLYANYAATNLAISLGLDSPADFLPTDAEELIRKAATSHEDRNFSREKELGGRFFSEYFYYSSEFNSLRIYAVDITARKQVEEENSELLLMLDLAPGMVIIHDAEGRFLYVNQCVYTLHGYSRDEFMKLTLQNIVAPGISEAIGKRISTIFEKGGDTFEVTHVKKNGAELPLMVNVRPCRWRNRQVLLSVCADLSDRKKSQALMQINELRLESLLRVSQYRAKDTADLLDMALHEAVILTGSAIGYIYNYYEDRREFVLNSWSKEVMKECSITEKQTVYPLDKTGIWGEAVRRRMPIMINDFDAPHPLKKGYPQGHAPLFRFLTIPVFSGEKIVAVVGVANKKEPYDDADVRQLTLMMNSIWKYVERKQLDDKTRMSELKFRSLFTSMHEGFALHEIVCDAGGSPCDYIVLDANPAFETITGIAPVEAIGKKASTLYGTGSAPFLDVYARVALTGEPAQFETDFAPTKKTFLISVSSPEKGKFATVFQDVTESKKAASALAESEKRSRSLFENSPVSIWEEDLFEVKKRFEELRSSGVTDLGLHLESATEELFFLASLVKIVDVNKASMEMLGAQSREDVIHGLPGYFIPEFMPAFKQEMVALFNGKTDFTSEISIFDTQGKPMHMSLKLSVIPGHEADLSRVLVSFIDRTDIKKAEAALQNSEKLESLGILAGGIAHEFNNLLNGIFGYIDLARSTTGDANAILNLNKAFLVFDRAKYLAQQLITFSKGGAPSKKITAMGPLARNAVSFGLTGSRVTVEWDIADNLYSCDVDETQISQALGNIAINAREAMGQSGTLFVSAHNAQEDKSPCYGLPPGSYVRISLHDTGPGIPPEHLDRIFDPFFTTKKAGSGLGLSTAFSIVKRHHGALTVASDPGNGAEFTMLLPASFPTAAATKNSDAPNGAPMRGRVLVVDDEECVLDIAKDMLEVSGFSTATAKSGDTAVAAFQKARDQGAPFDVVMLDLSIPGGMNGVTIAAKIIAIDPAARLIVSSGYSDHEVMVNFEDFGFKCAVEKPYRRADLLNALKKALG
jgi:two-component system cell cycle sensor histidine kinase/response regulator CckA